MLNGRLAGLLARRGPPIPPPVASSRPRPKFTVWRRHGAGGPARVGLAFDLQRRGSDVENVVRGAVPILGADQERQRCY